MIELLKRLFKRQKEADFNINHPEIRDQVELAFTAGGRDYYRFREEVNIPAGRYTYVDAFLREHEMRMSPEVMKGYIGAIREEISGKKGEINLHTVAVILYKMETRADLAFSPETIKRLASVMYFDKTESLKSYDVEYGKKKIAIWEKRGCLDFFFSKPMGELLGLQNTSPESLQNYLNQATQILQDLTSSPSTSSDPSS
jgi:hypothetical protein